MEKSENKLAESIDATQFSQITDNIFIGTSRAALDKEFIIEYKFNVIINCTTDEDFIKNSADTFIQNIAKYRIPLEDDPSEYDKYVKWLPISSKIINENVEKNNKIFIHCYAGCNRSPTVAASYFILYRNMIPEDAIELIRKKRCYAFACGYLWSILYDIYEKRSEINTKYPQLIICSN